MWCYSAHQTDHTIQRCTDVASRSGHPPRLYPPQRHRSRNRANRPGFGGPRGQVPPHAHQPRRTGRMANATRTRLVRPCVLTTSPTPRRWRSRQHDAILQAFHAAGVQNALVGNHSTTPAIRAEAHQLGGRSHFRGPLQTNAPSWTQPQATNLHKPFTASSAVVGDATASKPATDRGAADGHLRQKTRWTSGNSPYLAWTG